MPSEELLDYYVRNLDATSLKRLTSLMQGSKKLSKAECIEYIKATLQTPERIDKFLKEILPEERAALGILKLWGPTVLSFLRLGVRLTGTFVDNEDQFYLTSKSEEPNLLQRYLIMAGDNATSLFWSRDSSLVRADPRILARIRTLEHVPFRIKSVEPPAQAGHFRRPQNIMLDIVSMLNAIQGIGGIGITKSRTPRIVDLRKFARAMNWEDTLSWEGFTLFNPAETFARLLTLTAMVQVAEDRIVVNGVPTNFSSVSVVVLVRALLQGILNFDGWPEMEEDRNEANVFFPIGRLLLLVALSCLPAKREWIAFSDFEQAFFDRIGLQYSVSPRRVRGIFGNKSERQAQYMAQRQESRDHWIEYDVPWLEGALKGWLYMFGMVELNLSRDASHIESFRLTELGVSVLELGEEVAEKTKTELVPTWVVQPNFDVMVYMETASTEQLAFLAQYARQQSMAQHIAQYRISRDLIYEGLQQELQKERQQNKGAGRVADEGEQEIYLARLIQGLATHSRVPLPSNVVAEIRSWATLRERVTLYQKRDLLEFRDAKAREQAIAGGLTGSALGDRFLLLEKSVATDYVTQNSRHPATQKPAGQSKTQKINLRLIDYAEPPVLGSITVTERGEVTLVSDVFNLLTRSTLDLWAERIGENRWQLGQPRLREVVGKGRTHTELEKFLEERMSTKLPVLLKMALRNWVAAKTSLKLGDALVLQCRNAETVAELLASPALKPYIIGILGPGTLLLKRDHLQEVEKLLSWAGVAHGGNIEVLKADTSYLAEYQSNVYVSFQKYPKGW